MATHTPSPESPDARDETQDEKPKVSFLTLPQELRDHIYSFLPFGRAIISDLPPDSDHLQIRRLLRTCRTVHNDVLNMFWKARIFRYYLIMRDTAQNLPQPWTEKALGRITSLHLQFSFYFVVDQQVQSVIFDIRKTRGSWHVLPSPERAAFMSPDLIFAKTKERKERALKAEEAQRKREDDLLDNFLEKARPTIEQAQEEIRKNDRITLQALRLLGSCHDRRWNGRRARR